MQAIVEKLRQIFFFSALALPESQVSLIYNLPISPLYSVPGFKTASGETGDMVPLISGAYSLRSNFGDPKKTEVDAGLPVDAENIALVFSASRFLFSTSIFGGRPLLFCGGPRLR